MYFETGNTAYRLTHAIYSRHYNALQSTSVYKIDSYQQDFILKPRMHFSFPMTATCTPHVILIHFLAFKYLMIGHSNIVPVLL